MGIMDDTESETTAAETLSSALRQQAETQARRNAAPLDELNTPQLQELVHELRVHELELQIQNEELRDAQLALAHARDRYMMLYERAPIAYLTLSASGQILDCNLQAALTLSTERAGLIGQSIQHFIHPEYQDAFHLHLMQLFDTREKQVNEWRLHDRNQELLMVQVESLLQPDAEAQERWYLSMTDITKLKRLERTLSRLNRELEERVRDRSLRFKESQQAIQAILDAAADAIVTIDSEGMIEEYNRAALDLFGYRKEEMVNLPLQSLFPNWQIETTLQTMSEQAIRSEHNGQHRQGHNIPLDVAVTRVDHQDRYTCIMRDIREKRALQREVMQVAEEERSRISRELHDSLGQELAGMSMIARSIADTLAESDDRQAKQYQMFSKNLEGCVSQLRQIIFDLAPMDLDEGGLNQALKNLARSVSVQNPIECRCHCETELKIDQPELEIQLLRIAQEAVHNALKHAGAEHIDILLERVNDQLQLTIADDGRGLQTEHGAKFLGQGVRIMRYRANILGGKLELWPNEPNGTKVVCRI